MSVTKNSNPNQLQQFEMRLCHVYLHRTCNTMWSTAHASCIILWTFEEHSSSAHETLAYTTGTSSKHQRAMWPELYPKSIVFLRIVVFSHLPTFEVTVQDAATLSNTQQKTHFYFKFWNFLATKCDSKETHR